jgi:long-chain acyl-CoA synthetase
MVETINQLFINTIQTYPREDLMLYKSEGQYVPISTEVFGNKVKHFSLGLKEIGLNPEDKLVILSETRPEWVMTDIANLCAGGITVPIYPTLTPEQIKYIVEDSDARIVVYSDSEQGEKIAEIKPGFSKVTHYVTFESKAPDGVLTFDQILEKGRMIFEETPDLFDRTASLAKPETLASILYTSGTTGVPKGVMLTHNNFVSNAKGVTAVVEVSDKDKVLSWLPLSHSLERTATYTYLLVGCSIAYAENMLTVGQNMPEVRPTVVVGVPRLFEKVYAAVMDNVLSSSSLKRKLFFWATKVGREFGRRTLRGESIPKFLGFKRKIAHKLVFSKIIAKTGGRIRFFVSGAAPLSKDIAELFYAMGLIVLEGYGLTETSPVITLNSLEKIKFGTVGLPIPDVEVKIAPDGEILARGPNIMRGYYKKEEETKESIKDGWFYTGDIGHLDEDGFVVITDRKKDIIVTAGGKNVAPQPIENAVKTNAFVNDVLVVGDRRKFMSALVVPNFEKLVEYAKSNDILYKDKQDLIKNEDIVKFLEAEIDRATPHLASYEKIKKIVLLDRDFTISDGEITPTFKIKRNVVEKKYKDLIDALYVDDRSF